MMPRCSGGHGCISFAQHFDDCVEDRDEDQGKDRGRKHAAEHSRTNRLTARGACAGRDHQRHNAENEREGGHQDRPQPQASSFHCGFDDLKTFLAPPAREFHNQNRVLRRKADEHYEADLRIDVDLHAAQPQCQQSAE